MTRGDRDLGCVRTEVSVRGSPRSDALVVGPVAHPGGVTYRASRPGTKAPGDAGEGEGNLARPSRNGVAALGGSRTRCSRSFPFAESTSQKDDQDDQKNEADASTSEERTTEV